MQELIGRDPQKGQQSPKNLPARRYGHPVDARPNGRVPAEVAFPTGPKNSRLYGDARMLDREPEVVVVTKKIHHKEFVSLLVVLLVIVVVLAGLGVAAFLLGWI